MGGITGDLLNGLNLLKEGHTWFLFRDQSNAFGATVNIMVFMLSKQ